MSYSCSDFTDDVLNAFVARGLLKENDIEQNDPQQQAQVTLDAFNALITERDALKKALAETLK